MSRDTRQINTHRLQVMASARGHDGTVAHAFRHSEGLCPKCGCGKQVLFFCNPNGRDSPSLNGCELDGEHLHRGCAACKYCWVERCLDQAMMAEERGEVTAESEMAAALAVLTKQSGGVTFHRGVIDAHRGWILRFHRDQEAETVTLTATAPEPAGKPAKITPALFQQAEIVDDET
jgi:hypothetical protein